MNCEQTQAMFSEAYDQELGPLTASFEEHVSGCETCETARTEYNADIDLITPRLVGAAERLVVERQPVEPVRRDWRLAAIAAVFVGLAVTLSLSRNLAGPAASPPMRSTVAPNVLPVSHETGVPDCLKGGRQLVHDAMSQSHQQCDEDHDTASYQVSSAGLSPLQAVDAAFGPCPGLPVGGHDGEACLELGCRGLPRQLHWHLNGDALGGELLAGAYDMSGGYPEPPF